MKQNRSRMALVLAVLVSFGQTLLVSGQHGGHGGGMPEPTREFVKTGKYTGKVVTVDQSTIAIEVMKKGKTETFTFLKTDQTKSKGQGEAVPGAEVKIKYREEGGQMVATEIEVKKPRGV